MHNVIVMVTGFPRCGNNLMAAIIKELGYPGPSGELRSFDTQESMPSGSLVDPEFFNGYSDRSAPWVFRSHGFHQRCSARMSQRRDMIVVYMGRSLKTSQESFRRKLRKEGRSDEPQFALRRFNWYKRLARRWLNCWKGPIIQVKFDNLIAHPEQTVSGIARLLDVPIARSAIELVRPDLDHTAELFDNG